MEFKKTVMFLGMKRRSGKNGLAYMVDLFCPGGDHWELYLKDVPENGAIIDYLLRAGCGTFIDATFRVGQYQNNVSLRLIGAENASE